MGAGFQHSCFVQIRLCLTVPAFPSPETAGYGPLPTGWAAQTPHELEHHSPLPRTNGHRNLDDGEQIHPDLRGREGQQKKDARTTLCSPTVRRLTRSHPGSAHLWDIGRSSY